MTDTTTLDPPGNVHQLNRGNIIPPLDFRSPQPEGPKVAAVPSNIEAEQALLGALLYDNAAYERLSDSFGAGAFYEPFHQRLFASVEAAIKRGQLAEPILLDTQFLKDPAYQELGGLRYLADLVDRAPPAALSADYARALADLAVRREVLRLSGEMAKAATDYADGMTSRDLIEAAEARLYALAEPSGGTARADGFVNFADALTGAVQMAAEAYSRDGGLAGISTGLIDLDQMLGGLHPSDLLIIAGRPSQGKAQPLTAKVLLRDGSWRAMSELRLGDHLASIDGAPSRVAGIFPQGDRKVYRVSFRDGRSTECCAEHLWSVHYRSWGAPRTLNTAQVAALLTRRRYVHRIWIDTATGDFGADVGLRVDPWVLGALLGDGSTMGNQVRFSTADAEILETMQRRLGPGLAVRRISGAKPCDYRIVSAGGHRVAGHQGVLPNALKVALQDIGAWGAPAHEKRIPSAYLTASRETRVELLRGLFDTDGWVEKDGSILFGSSSEQLMKDVIALVRSLGGSALMRRKAPTYTYKGEKHQGRPAYLANIQNMRVEEIFTLKRKLDRVSPPQRRARLCFSSIEEIEAAPVQCIQVTHPSSLYVTDDYVVTHNTALATNIAFNVARRYTFSLQPDGTIKTESGGRVGFFSLEMSAEQLAMRVLADVSGVSSDRLRRGEIEASELGRVRDAAIEIQESPLYIDATGGLAIAKLAARARRMKRKHGLDLIVVDYLQLATVDGGKASDNRVQEVSAITGGLKALAKELGVPVIALSQLSRQVENREDKRPQLSDLRESGSIEQDADVVMFVYREAYYLSRVEPREGTPEHMEWQGRMDEVRRQADLIIGKQRHGPIGTVKLDFDADTTRFSNAARCGRGGRP